MVCIIKSIAIKLSHDAVIRGIVSRNYTPTVVWDNANNLIDNSQSCLLIADSTVLDKTRNEKIHFVNVTNNICIVVLAWIYRFKKQLIDSCSSYKQQWLNIKNSINAKLQIILA